jgi:hypothetical protein
LTRKVCDAVAGCVPHLRFIAACGNDVGLLWHHCQPVHIKPAMRDTLQAVPRNKAQQVQTFVNRLLLVASCCTAYHCCCCCCLPLHMSLHVLRQCAPQLSGAVGSCAASLMPTADTLARDSSNNTPVMHSWLCPPSARAPAAVAATHAAATPRCSRSAVMFGANRQILPTSYVPR